MMMDELVSVIVPVFNVQKYIDECVESIMNQSYKKIEIILVDDGSTDYSGKRCDYYASKDERIKVIHKSNEGLSSARNVGIDMMSGNYVFFVDSDDYLNLETIQKHVEAIQKSNADMVIGTMVEFVNQIKFSNTTFEPYVCEAKDVIRKMLMNEGLDHGIHGVLYKKELFSEIRFPIGLLYEDFATIYYLVAMCRSIVMIDDKGYYYRVRQGSIMTSNMTEKNMTLINTAKNVCLDMLKQYPDMKVAVIRKVVITYMNLYYGILSSGFNAFESEQKIILDFLIQNNTTFFDSREIKEREKIKLRLLLLGKIPFYIVWKTRDFFRGRAKLRKVMSCRKAR